MGHKLMKLPSVKLVIDHRVDTTPPVVHSIVVHPTNVTNTHASVSVTLKIGDDRSGININSLFVEFDNGVEVYNSKRKTLTCKFPHHENGNGGVYHAEVDDDQVDNFGRRIMFTTVTCKMTLPRGSESGNFSLSHIYVSDVKDNWFSACCSPPSPGSSCGCDVLQAINALLPPSQQLPALPSFEFTDTGPIDTQAPIFHSVVPTPMSVQHNSHVNFTAKFTDNISGVNIETIDLSFAGPNGHTVYCYNWEKTSMGPNTMVKVACSARIYNFTSVGTYTLHHVYVRDIIGNTWDTYGNASTVLKDVNKRLPKGSKLMKIPSFKVIV